MKKIKIAYLSCVYPPYKGGIGNVCFEQNNRLNKDEFECLVITPCYGKEGYKSCLNPFFSYGNAAVLLQLPFQLKDIDIIHFHYPFLGTDMVLVLTHFFRKYVLRKKTKLVLHYHMDLIPNNIITKIVFGFTKLFTLPLLLAMSDRIIVTSMDYAMHCDISLYVKKHESKIEMIPNGVDMKRFSPKERDERLMKKYLINKEDFVLLFVGGLDEAHFFKGVCVLIEAMNILSKKGVSPIKVLIVGQGNRKEIYEREVKEKQLEKMIFFAGGIDNDVLPEMYRLSDVLVLPSTTQSEAFGMVLIEAFATKKPVITSNLPGVRSVVDEEKNAFLVTPNDAFDLAKKIQKLKEDASLRERFGEVGYIKAKTFFDWKKVIESLEKLYHELV